MWKALLVILITFYNRVLYRSLKMIAGNSFREESICCQILGRLNMIDLFPYWEQTGWQKYWPESCLNCNIFAQTLKWVSYSSTLLKLKHEVARNNFLYLNIGYLMCFLWHNKLSFIHSITKKISLILLDNAQTSVHDFCDICLEYVTNQNFRWCAFTPAHPHHCLDMWETVCFLLHWNKILISFWVHQQPNESRKIITWFYSIYLYLCFDNSVLPHCCKILCWLRCRI